MAISGDTAARPASATPASRRDVLKYVGTYEDFRGFHPLGEASSSFAIDRVGPVLSRVNCLLSFMQAAYEDSAALQQKGLESAVDQRVGEIVSGALDGLQTLVGLAIFLLDDVEG